MLSEGHLNVKYQVVTVRIVLVNEWVFNKLGHSHWNIHIQETRNNNIHSEFLELFVFDVFGLIYFDIVIVVIRWDLLRLFLLEYELSIKVLPDVDVNELRKMNDYKDGDYSTFLSYKIIFSHRYYEIWKLNKNLLT